MISLKIVFFLFFFLLLVFIHDWRELFSLRSVGWRLLVPALTREVERLFDGFRTVLLDEILHLGELRAQLLLNRREIALL